MTVSSFALAALFPEEEKETHTVTFLSQGISFKSEQRKLRAVQGELNVQMACCISKTDN